MKRLHESVRLPVKGTTLALTVLELFLGASLPDRRDDSVLGQGVN